MTKMILFFLLGGLIIAAFTPPADAVDTMGAEKIMISGGNRGDILFPHRQHQSRLTDCKFCHELIPKASGSIDALKSEKKISDKQVMNTLCIDCHRAKRVAGERSGPEACNMCHHK